MTVESDLKARWTSYFEWLYQADPRAVELDVRGVTIPIADPPINCGPPSFVETRAAVNRLKWGKAPGICGIHAEFLKPDGNAALVSLLQSWRSPFLFERGTTRLLFHSVGMMPVFQAEHRTVCIDMRTGS